MFQEEDDPILVAERLRLELQDQAVLESRQQALLLDDGDDPILVAERQKLDQDDQDYHHFLRTSGTNAFGNQLQHHDLTERERRLRPKKFARRGSDKGKGTKYKKRRYPTAQPTPAPTYPTDSQCYVDPSRQPTPSPNADSSSKSSKSSGDGKGNSVKRVKCKKDEVSVCQRIWW